VLALGAACNEIDPVTAPIQAPQAGAVIIAADRTREPESPAETPPPDEGASEDPIYFPGDPSMTPAPTPPPAEPAPAPESPEPSEPLSTFGSAGTTTTRTATGIASNGTRAQWFGGIPPIEPLANIKVVGIHGITNGVAVWIETDQPEQQPRIQTTTRHWYEPAWEHGPCDPFRRLHVHGDVAIWECEIFSHFFGPTWVRWRALGPYGGPMGEWSEFPQMAWADPIRYNPTEGAQKFWIERWQPYTTIGNDAYGPALRMEVRIHECGWGAPVPNRQMNFWNCNRVRELDVRFRPGSPFLSTRMVARNRDLSWTAAARVVHTDFPPVKPGYWLACEVVKYDNSGRRTRWATERSTYTEPDYYCTPP